MSWCGRGVPAVQLLLFTWVLLLVAGVVRSHQANRRQINLPEISLGCINAFFSLEATDAACLLRLGESVGFENGTITIELTTDQLEFACGSPNCERAFLTLIEACENEVRGAIDLSDAVDLVDLLLLLCVRDQNDSYCYHQLERPILQNDHDPLLLCNLRTSQQQRCSADCNTSLSRYTSTCCLVSYLYLVAGNSVEQQNISTSLVWQSCNLTAPTVCPGVATDPATDPTASTSSNGSSNPTSCSNSALSGNGNGGSDDDNDNNAGVIVGAVIGSLIVILLIVILGVQLTYITWKYRARGSSSYSVNSRDEMKLKFADHEHTEAMTT